MTTKLELKAIELTEGERRRFVEHFYDQWNPEEMGAIEDVDSPCPWGCPWLYGSDTLLEGNSIEEMAINYFNFRKETIKKAIKYENENTLK